MERYGFERHQRLLNAHAFKQVFDQTDAKISHQALLILARRQPAPDTPARLGLIVAKKHLKRAVSRNQFKRITRESFRQQQHRLVGLDIIVLARAGARDLDRQALAMIVQQNWDRLMKRLPPPDQVTPLQEPPP